MKWLNTSLIHGIWNLIFTLTNVALFLLLPFAYLFCESEGFTGARRGLVNRAKETLVTLLLLSVVVCGSMYILAALIDRDQHTIDTLVNMYSYYLPFLYSCVSFLGVLLLLVCTPLGFVKLFTLVAELVTRQQFLSDLTEEYQLALMEEAATKKKVEMSNGKYNGKMNLANGHHDREYLELQHGEAVARRLVIERDRARGVVLRRLGWPAAMLSLMSLTGISLYLVATNMLLLLAGWRSLPSSQVTLDLGTSSLTNLGVLGVVIEVLIIAYFLLSSIVGLYSLRPLLKILPVKRYRLKSMISTTPFENLIFRDTSMTHLIYNCALYVILSSALPLLVKVLGKASHCQHVFSIVRSFMLTYHLCFSGITNFDLLGNYGKIRWLGNYFLVFAVNFLFGGAAALCLFDRVTHR